MLREAELAGSCSTSAINSSTIHTGHPSRRTVGHSTQLLCLVQELPISTVTDPSMRRALRSLAHWRMNTSGACLLALISGGMQNLQMWVSAETSRGDCSPSFRCLILMSSPCPKQSKLLAHCTLVKEVTAGASGPSSATLDTGANNVAWSWTLTDQLRCQLFAPLAPRYTDKRPRRSCLFYRSRDVTGTDPYTDLLFGLNPQEADDEAQPCVPCAGRLTGAVSCR